MYYMIKKGAVPKVCNNLCNILKVGEKAKIWSIFHNESRKLALFS
jgi:hypothetical protein